MKRRMYCIGWVCITMIVACGLSPVAAAQVSQQAADVLEEAQRLYDEGVTLMRQDRAAARQAFAESARLYETIVNQGVVGGDEGGADGGVENGYLLYNLGNAHLQAGDLGRAILAYRRAQRLISGDGRLEHNLHAARSMRRDQIAPAAAAAVGEALFEWPRRFSVQTRFNCFAIAYAIFWAALGVFMFRRTASWRWLAIVSGLSWIIAGATLVSDVVSDRDSGGGGGAVGGGGGGGVIVADEVIVRKGNGEGFEPQFEQPLHAGTEFDVLERRGGKDGWFHIELPDNSSGWIPTSAAELIGAPAT